MSTFFSTKLKAALAVLSPVFLAGCLSHQMERHRVDGISVFEVQRGSSIEFIVRSNRPFGKELLPDRCIFDRRYSAAEHWFSLELLELGLEGNRLSGQACTVFESDIPDDHVEIRAGLAQAAIDYMTLVGALLGHEKPLSIELKLVPDKYSFRFDSHVDPEADAWRVEMAFPIAYDSSFESSLTMALSVVVHEAMHLMARRIDFFDSLAQEELFAYTLDRCFRIQTIGDLDFWAPNFQVEPPENWLDEVLKLYGSVDELIDNIVTDASTRPSVQGMGTAIVLFLWAVHRWEPEHNGESDREELLSDWCNLVLDDPLGTFSVWPAIAH